MVSGQFGADSPVYEQFDAAALAAGTALVSNDGVPLVDCGAGPSGHVIRIVEPATGVECPDGRIGEIWFAGASVAAGYWNNPVATEGAFRAEIVGRPGEYCLRTGDLGFVHRGKLFVRGRVKDLIIIRGQNIDPLDIEQAVEEAVRGVRKGRIAAFPVVLNEVEGIGIAAEIPRSLVNDNDGMSAILRDIRRAVFDSSGEFADLVLLLPPGGLPRTSSGKIRRATCAESWHDGSLNPTRVLRSDLMEPDVIRSGTRFAAPSDLVEKRLAAFWSGILGVDSVGRDDDFLDIGGNSLSIAQLAARIVSEFGIDLPIPKLFEARTIAAQARLVSDFRNRPTALPRLASRPSTASSALLPLSFGQERLWYLWKLEPSSAAYTIALSVRLKGALQPARLREAFAGVVDRHESLRTRFVERDGTAWQAIDADGGLAWSEHDLSARPDMEASVSSRLRAAALAPFDLERGPLLRVMLLRLDDSTHVLSLALHHIVSDGWSMAVLLREVSALYRGEHLAAAALQYGDYAVWQREWLSGSALDEQLAYWRTRLGDEHPVLELPADRPRGMRRDGAGGRVTRLLPAALTSRVRAVSRAHGLTPFMTLLTGFALLLYRHGGQSDLRIGVPVANRRRVETEGVIGFFVNTLVLRIEVAGVTAGLGAAGGGA